MLPDNTYQVRLDAIYIAKSKASERWQTVMELEVMSGSYAFRTIYKYCQMTTSQNLDFLTNDLRKLGVSEKFKWTNLEKEFAKIVDHLYEIALKTKGEFQNVYIQKELTPEQVLQDKTTSNTPDAEDDVPF